MHCRMKSNEMNNELKWNESKKHLSREHNRPTLICSLLFCCVIIPSLITPSPVQPLLYKADNIFRPSQGVLHGFPVL
jgi:hypothetical protein